MQNQRAIFTEQIRQKALELGFDAFGVSRADFVGDTVADGYDAWLKKGFHATLDYLERNKEKRYDPRLLVENTKSIISVAMNYYPSQKQPKEVPQFAYYAYGKDYHDVMKDRLKKLLTYVMEIVPEAEGRCFVDSAPVLESFWAMKAGIGYKGKNTLLIIPGKGSYFFLGEIFLNIELEYSKPYEKSLCGSCRKCIDACPAGAIMEGGCLNAERCISYQTIENKSDKISEPVASKMSNRVYGCDICQQVCPWNKKSQPHQTPDFNPSQAFLSLTKEALEQLTEEDFRLIFKGSAVKRAKYKGLMRNVQALSGEDKDSE